MGMNQVPRAILGLALSLVGVAAAQAAPADSAAAEADAPHDGVSFGVRLGPGFLYATFDDARRAGDARIWGQSYFVNAWAGFSITPQLVLSAEFNRAHAFSPSSGFEGMMESLDLSAAGPSVKYYLGSDNVYVSASLLLSRLSFQGGGYRDNGEQTTHWGATGRLGAGKEWQVSPSWRVGLEGEVLLGWMDFDPGFPDVIVAVKGAALLASVAYDGHQNQATEWDVRNRIYAEARLGVGKLRWRNADTALYWQDAGIGRTAWAMTIPMAVAVGWAITPRLIVLGEFVDSRHRDIETDAPGALQGVCSYGLGPGLKYYLTETNLFVAGSLSWFRIDQTGWGNYGGTLVQSGMAARLALGKEVRFSPNWGLGVGAELLLARMSAGDLGAYWATGAEVLSSLTYRFGPAPETPPIEREIRPPTPGEHTHDGLYVGMRAGVGRLRNPAFGNRDYGVLEGRDLQLALAVGAAVSRHVILFGELSESQVRQSDGMDPGDFSLVVAGPGVAYYLEPSNVFFSGALGWAGFGSTRAWDHSGQGMTGRLSVGKEWWVSSNWGLGLAAEALFGNLSFGSVSGFSLQAVSSFN